MLTEFMHDWALWGIDHGGYSAAVVLMAMESMIFPVPSEIVLPPMGMKIAGHAAGFHPTFTLALIAGTVGSLIGSLLSYYMGYFGGKPLVMKIGRFFLVNESHLDLTTRWFKRWGSLTVFISRFIPVVRHFISIPAGIAKMNLLKFSIYTVLGAGLYNAFLIYLGYKLQAKWTLILNYTHYIDPAIVAVMVIVVAGWIYLHLRRPKPRDNQFPSEPAA